MAGYIEFFRCRISRKRSKAHCKEPIDDRALASIRELYLLRDDIQAQASNGSFSKDKYNAITNQFVRFT